MQEEKARLQHEAEKLAQRLQAVLSEKFVRRGTFDAETPIDKTLGYLQSIMSVSGAQHFLGDAMLPGNVHATNLCKGSSCPVGHGMSCSTCMPPSGLDIQVHANPGVVRPRAGSCQRNI